MRRRRPLLRAATVAGGAAVAYHAGKSHQAGQQREADQDAQLQELQAAPAAPAAAAAAPGGLTDDSIARLKQLGQLHDQGILSDQEFEAEKNKILNG
jgi:hypothetical protein